MVLLAVAIFAVNGLTVGRLQFVSVVDEGAWIDYAVRASKFELVQPGDKLDEDSLRELCIRKSESQQYKHCDPDRPRTVRNFAGHSPFYFYSVAPLARALQALPLDLPPDDSLITWIRLLGSVWLLLGLYFGLRAGELLGVARVPLFFALLLIGFAPVLLHASTIVNPDVTALPAGAAVLWAALCWERGRTSRNLAVLAAVSAVAVLLDETNGVAVMIAVAYLATRMLQGVRADPRWRARMREVVVLGAWIFGTSVVAKYGWDLVESLLIDHVIGRHDNPVNPNVRLFRIHGFPPIEVFLGPNRIFGLLPPIIDATPPSVRQEALYDGFGQAAFFIAAGALVGRTLWAKLADRLDSLAAVTTTTLLLGGPLTAVYFYVTASVATRPTARFGLSALPAVALVIASTARSRFTRGLVGFVAVGLGVTAVVVLF